MNKALLGVVVVVLVAAVLLVASGSFTGMVVAPGTATLYGQLTDDLTGEPVAGEPVTVGDVTVLTDTAGNYVVSGLEPGTYLVVWGGDEFVSIQSPELLSEDQALKRDILISMKGR